MTREDAVSNSAVPVRRSPFAVLRDHAVLFTLAALTGAAIAGAAIVLGGGDSDEAPIRVKNGSLDVHIVSNAQEWADDNGDWHIDGASRHKEEFEVTIAVREGASCAPSKVATGQNVEITFNDGRVIRLQSAGHKTKIKHNNVVGKIGPQQLRYGTAGAGFIRQVAVGSGGNPSVLCTFTAAQQLDHLIILNVP
jgi:hypothetical protein